MDKVEYRSVIRFLYLDGKNCEEIKTKLQAVYGNLAPSMTTIRYWFNEFKRGRTNVCDEDRPGRPNEVTTEETIKQINDIVTNDPTVTVRKIVEVVGISDERVRNILHEHLHMKKEATKWVPRSHEITQNSSMI